MSDSIEKIEYGKIINIEIYLQRFQENLHKKSLADQIAFKDEIKKHHDKKEIQMFLGRLEDQIENKKALNHFTTAFFAILSFVLGSTMNYGLKLVTDADADAAPTIILLVFYSAVLIWFGVSGWESRCLKKLSLYKRLLQECLDELPEKRHSRRIQKSTRHLTK
ncbi:MULTISPECIES: hypothetical protein [Bacillus]|uniref:hypothetical protein n=1 Tax=Bacillus TaxID=1386 RepID=UPI00047C7EF2|nr:MULTISPECIES: hypothetical protein [Bacillus]QHZ48346.1 hypothetical protein M654_019740 [Bacillus sp. NSP9.1]